MIDVTRATADANVDADGNFGPIRFPAGLAVFDGHFPGAPLVPGVYLIEVARVLAGRAIGRDVALRAVVDAKFTRMVLPDEPVEGKLVLTAADDGSHHCDVALRVGDEPAARLRLRLG